MGVVVRNERFSSISDGVVALRSPMESEAAVLSWGRDREIERWLGASSAVAMPLACVIVGEQVIGWIDFDLDREWLGIRQVNVGYCIFAEWRRNGYATVAVELLLRHLADETDVEVATLLIDRENLASLVVAVRAGFVADASPAGASAYFRRVVDRRSAR